MIRPLQPRKLTAEELAALTPRTFDLANIFSDRDALASPRGCLLVVEDNEEFVACAGLVPIDAQTAEIRPFVVTYAYRGRGLGSRLIGMLLAEARAAGYQRLVSHVEPWCPEWRAFYRAHGFAPVPERQTPQAVELALSLG